MSELVTTPAYTGPDRRIAGQDRRTGDRRSSFDDIPMVVDRRRSSDRRRNPDRRNQAAMILNTPILRRKEGDVRA